MKTLEKTALDHGLCRCDEAYTKRGLTAPDCPYHAFAVEEAMKDYATKAIKADRERTTHAATEKYKETGMTNTAANVKEIILNLPIELP